jgi:hypothetical protein
MTTTIDELLNSSGIEKKTAYRPFEVCAILSITETTFRRICDRWEPASVHKDSPGLECYRIGKHRRVPHHALVEFLEKQSNYEFLYR